MDNNECRKRSKIEIFVLNTGTFYGTVPVTMKVAEGRYGSISIYRLERVNSGIRYRILILTLFNRFIFHVNFHY